MENDKIKDFELEKVKKQKEESDQLLLRLEIVVACLGMLIFFSDLFVSVFVEIPLWLKIILPVVSFVVMLFTFFVALKIEQKAGYYECPVCHHKYIPTDKQMIMSMHMGRTRYFKCPHCGRKAWNKKVVK